MSYRCKICGSFFDEPDELAFCFEDEAGVSSMFSTHTYGCENVCPECGSPNIEAFDLENEVDIDLICDDELAIEMSVIDDTLRVECDENGLICRLVTSKGEFVPAAARRPGDVQKERRQQGYE